MDPCLSVEAGHENTKSESSGTSSTKGGSESTSTSNEESSSSSSSQGSSNTEGSSNSDTSSDSTSLNQGTSRDVSQVKSDLSSLNMFDNINNTYNKLSTMLLPGQDVQHQQMPVRIYRNWQYKRSKRKSRTRWRQDIWKVLWNSRGHALSSPFSCNDWNRKLLC